MSACCMSQQQQQQQQASVQQVDLCQLPPSSGSCFMRLRRWYYNPSTGSCERFVYRGCRGNMNNFEFKAECERNCIINGDDGGMESDGDDDLEDVFGGFFGQPSSLFKNI